VRLGTHHANRAAELYRRLGFREYARDETHVHMEWRST
jgi:ribosomal protein S18 acetylase RimI-like enzyme